MDYNFTAYYVYRSFLNFNDLKSIANNSWKMIEYCYRILDVIFKSLTTTFLSGTIKKLLLWKGPFLFYFLDDLMKRWQYAPGSSGLRNKTTTSKWITVTFITLNHSICNSRCKLRESVKFGILGVIPDLRASIQSPQAITPELCSRNFVIIRKCEILNKGVGTHTGNDVAGCF